MGKQVLTIGPDGSMETLDFKGEGVDLRDHGHVSVQRISDIKWDEAKQGWTVVPCFGLMAEEAITIEDIPSDVVVDCCSQILQGSAVGPEAVLIFKEYDEAVAFEVAFIQSCKLRGFSDLIYDV